MKADWSEVSPIHFFEFCARAKASNSLLPMKEQPKWSRDEQNRWLKKEYERLYLKEKI
jgi:hypothetical protein